MRRLTTLCSRFCNKRREFEYEHPAVSRQVQRTVPPETARAITEICASDSADSRAALFSRQLRVTDAAIFILEKSVK